MPAAVLKQTGTGVVTWTPDTFQSPFQLGMALTFSGGTASVDVTFDDISSIDVNGVASASATWWTVIALGGTNATANYTTPVQALRLNVASALATSLVTLTVVQAWGAT